MYGLYYEFQVILSHATVSFRARILEQSMGARNRVGIGFVEPAPPGYIGWWNRFLCSLKVLKYRPCLVFHYTLLPSLPLGLVLFSVDILLPQSQDQRKNTHYSFLYSHSYVN
jgi:hypothetical protein